MDSYMAKAIKSAALFAALHPADAAQRRRRAKRQPVELVRPGNPTRTLERLVGRIDSHA
jgi:hypothetical protein